jgi:hypothetical protein
MSRELSLLIGIALVAMGCARAEVDVPTTHPAKGTLHTRDGQPVTGGTIQLLPADGAARPATIALVQPDGAFELQARDNAGKKHPGAEEGVYTVLYLPVMTDDQNIQQVTLPGKVTVRPGENTFNLKLP